LISALQSTSRIRRATLTILRQEFTKNAFLVFGGKFDGLDIDADAIGDGNGVNEVWRELQYSSVSSSSQFFMKSPTTSCPCCLSNSAATDESTPARKAHDDTYFLAGMERSMAVRVGRRVRV
jgi:hypothetical protein